MSILKTQTASKKRILSVAVIRAVDTDPDTSYYGEYANSPTSEYSIDRAHSEDCQSVSPEVKAVIESLERAVTWIEREKYDQNGSDFYPESIDDAIEILEEHAEELAECDCGERGDMERGQYRYFNPSGNYDGEPAEDQRKYVRQDYDRMEDYNRGGWCFTGTYATAEVQTSQHSTIQTIRSGGLWGTESDSDDSHFAEIEKDELADLRRELESIGFTKRAVSAAFRTIEHKDE